MDDEEKTCKCGRKFTSHAWGCHECYYAEIFKEATIITPVSTPLPKSRLLTPAEKRKQLDLKHAADIVALKEKVIAAVEKSTGYTTDIDGVQDLSLIEGWLKDHGWKWRCRACGYNESVATVEPLLSTPPYAYR